MSNTTTRDQQLEQLSDQIRLALQAAHEAGYQAARYTHNVEPDEAKAHAQLEEARTSERTATAVLWGTWYDTMSQL